MKKPDDVMAECTVEISRLLAVNGYTGNKAILLVRKVAKKTKNPDWCYIQNPEQYRRLIKAVEEYLLGPSLFEPQFVQLSLF